MNENPLTLASSLESALGAIKRKLEEEQLAIIAGELQEIERIIGSLNCLQ